MRTRHLASPGSRARDVHEQVIDPRTRALGGGRLDEETAHHRGCRGSLADVQIRPVQALSRIGGGERAGIAVVDHDGGRSAHPGSPVALDLAVNVPVVIAPPDLDLDHRAATGPRELEIGPPGALDRLAQVGFDLAAGLSARIHSGLEERVDWRELLRQTGESVSGRAHINETTRGHFTSFATQVAEVSVDPETGEIRLLKFTTVHDTGQVLNAIGHQGQINGGVVQGIGFALMEELAVEDGRVTTGSFGDYKLPNIMDIPELKTVLLQSENGYGPYGIRGIGEGPHIPVAAAVANAVVDAVGARVRDLPVTAEKVYCALKGSPE